MTTVNTRTPQQDEATSDGIEDAGTFQVLVSYYRRHGRGLR